MPTGLVEEAQHAADPPVFVSHCDVEPDRERLPAGRGHELLRETNDVVVRVEFPPVVRKPNGWRSLAGRRPKVGRGFHAETIGYQRASRERSSSVAEQGRWTVSAR